MGRHSAWDAGPLLWRELMVDLSTVSSVHVYSAFNSDSEKHELNLSFFNEAHDQVFAQVLDPEIAHKLAIKWLNAVFTEKFLSSFAAVSDIISIPREFIAIMSYNLKTSIDHDEIAPELVAIYDSIPLHFVLITSASNFSPKVHVQIRNSEDSIVTIAQWELQQLIDFALCMIEGARRVHLDTHLYTFLTETVGTSAKAALQVIALLGNSGDE